jgi:very-short-patch-repair endonuclease
MNQIETKFYEAFSDILQRGFVIYQDQKVGIKKDDEDFYVINLNNDSLEFTFEIQPKVDYLAGYIPDFLITVNNLFSGYCIEIDGHEWHEKTKEQVRADKEKDRAYLKNGFIPVRFTGSEVYHDAKKCVDEFFEIMITNYEFFNYEKLNIKNYMLYCEIHGEQK